jgi:hypothetical protein
LQITIHRIILDSEEENAAESSTSSAIRIYEGAEKQHSLGTVSFQEPCDMTGNIEKRCSLQPRTPHL